MLKRPMCLIGLAVVLIVLLLIKVMEVPVLTERAGIQDGQYIDLTGQVRQKETKQGKSIIYLENVIIQQSSETIQENSQETYSIIAYLADNTQFKLGSTIALGGKVSLFDAAENDGQFDAARYYEINGIDFAVKNASVTAMSRDYDKWREKLYQCRERMKAVYRKLMSEKEAGILHALLLGDKSSLDTEIKELYMRAGIVHILSLSGLHIATAGMCLLMLLQKLRIGILPAGGISIFLIIQYGVMTGLQTSTFRALVMFLLGVIALCIGRTYDLLSGMTLAAVMMVLDNPLYLYHTGFLLSFGAVMGIGLIHPCIIWLIAPRYRRNKLVQSICISLSTQLATLPVILSSYYQVSICGILLNLVVVPLMTFVLAFGILGGLAGLWLDLVGYGLLLPCRWILWLYEWLSEYATRLPGSVWITGKPELWRAVVYYVLLFSFLILLSCIKSKFKYRTCNYIGKLRILGVCVMLTIGMMLTKRKSEDFTITMLSVGQGECTVIHGQDVPTVMIDGGSTDIKEVGKYRMIPYLKANRLHRIDTVLVSHTDTDHISGILEILQSPEQGIRIRRLILPAIPMELQEEHYEALVQAAQAVGTQVYVMGRGERLCIENGRSWFAKQFKGQLQTGDYDYGMEFTCLHPSQLTMGDLNEHSMVFVMSYVNLNMLFTGDISSSAEAELTGLVPNCTVLKVPHHGSRFSSGEAFLQAAAPKLALISAGKDNSYGHPHEETLQKLSNIPVYITFETGQIDLIPERRKIQVRTFLQD